MPDVQYVIFETRWGPAGIRGRAGRVERFCLPPQDADALERDLREPGPARLNQTFLADLQRAVQTYFQGDTVDFRPFALDLDDVSPFTRRVLDACRSVPYGQTLTYGGLALRAGCPGAARAVGGVMRRNPVPLLVPCHRILPSSGGVGGFSGPGGPRLKQRLLDLERFAISQAPSRCIPVQGR